MTIVKKITRHLYTGNGPVQRDNVEESTWYKRIMHQPFETLAPTGAGIAGTLNGA